MSCKYDLEDIIKYFEGDFSKEKKDEISFHLKECKRCSTMYSSLNLTEKFVDYEVEYKGKVFSSIEGAIDKNRYRGRKGFYFIGKLLSSNSYILKGAATVAVVCICVIFALWNWPLNSGKYMKGNGTEKLGEPNVSGELTSSPITEPTSSPTDSNDNYTKKGQFAQSPNGEMTAEVVREKGMFVDTVLITDKNNETFKIVLENIMYTYIEDFSWIDDTRIALWTHVNPSLQVYVVMGADSKSMVGVYKGLGFAWNKNKDRLYYVKPSPQFSEEHVGDEIVDDEDNIYYKTESGTFIRGTIAISDDEEKFAFFVDDIYLEKQNLVICKMDEGNKLKKELEIDAPFGEIKFNDNNSVSVADINKNITSYDLE